MTPMMVLLDVLSPFANTQTTASYFRSVAQAGTCVVLCKSEDWDIYSEEMSKKQEDDQ